MVMKLYIGHVTVFCVGLFKTAFLVRNATFTRTWLHFATVVFAFNPFSPNSEQDQFSLNGVHTISRD